MSDESEDLNEVLRLGRVAPITFEIKVPEHARPRNPRLETPPPVFKCKHPVSYTHWEDDGRWCDKCNTIIMPPRT